MVHTEGGIKHRLCLWLEDPFRTVEIVVRTRDGHIHVWNAWHFVREKKTWVWGDRGPERLAFIRVIPGIEARRMGAGMIVEEIENGFRYHCNDGYRDEDFNDIVFRIERCEE
jgi:hypothetical protein